MRAFDLQQLFEPKSKVDVERACVAARHDSEHHRQVEDDKRVAKRLPDELAVHPAGITHHVHPTRTAVEPLVSHHTNQLTIDDPPERAKIHAPRQSRAVVDVLVQNENRLLNEEVPF